MTETEEMNNETLTKDKPKEEVFFKLYQHVLI
jgi:hypothetical protein